MPSFSDKRGLTIHVSGAGQNVQNCLSIRTVVIFQCLIENLIDRRQRNTRAYDAIVFTTQFPRCNKYKQSTLFRGATAWNQLPVHERNIASYSRFKYIQKRAMLEVNNFLFPQ